MAIGLRFKKIDNFYDNGYDPRLRLRPTHKQFERPLALLQLEKSLTDIISCHKRPKVNLRLYRYFRNFKRNPAIRITQSDKNLGLCILKTEHYHDLCMAHLSCTEIYREVLLSEEELITKVLQYSKNLLSIVSRHLNITPYVRKFLTEPHLDLPNFHSIPKLHKPGPLKSRPIVGAVNWITTPWSKYLDVLISEWPTQYTCKNSFEVCKDLAESSLDLSNCLLVTMDVASLYTNMDIERLIRILDSKNRVCAWICRFICNNNYFKYCNKIYHQKGGIAMGTNAAVNLANHYLDNGFDDEVVKNKQVIYYKRYIDDIFLIWHGDAASLQQAFAEFNQLIPGIKLTMEYSNKSIPFLDVEIFIDGNQVLTRVFQKTLNRYQYIIPTSNHPTANLRGFIKGELIRYLRLSSLQKDFHHLKYLFATRLLAEVHSVNIFIDSVGR